MRADALSTVCIGLAGYFRLSYANSEQKRIAKACRELS
jgi:hypothetical protein